jgi:hypothetical protein
LNKLLGGVASNTAEPAPAQDEAAPVEKFERLFCSVVCSAVCVEQEKAKERTRTSEEAWTKEGCEEILTASPSPYLQS